MADETIDIDQIELIDRKALLPPGWRRLLEALECRGVRVSQIANRTRNDADTDLGRVQRYIQSGPTADLEGDGTFVHLEAASALLAAEAVADWLACDESQGRGTVVLCPDGDSALLDSAIRRRGLPSLGLSARSPYRGALQVLALAFAVAWRPFDPQKLLELLTLPRPPFRRFAARKLARALEREPGIGGPAWKEAWDEIEGVLVGEIEGCPTTVASTLANWRAWMNVGQFDQSEGMPANEAAAICERALRWAIELDHGERDPLLLCVLGGARTLATALKALGKSPVSRLQIDRMIDQALAEGLPNPAHVAEEGYIRAIEEPGAIWGEVPTLVWWNFCAPPKPPSTTWSASERHVLSAAGCCPEDPKETIARESLQDQRALLNAGACVVLVRPALNRGEETLSHRLWHRIEPVLAIGCNREKITDRAETLLSRDQVSVAGRDIKRQKADHLAVPTASPLWPLPPILFEQLKSRSESATSFVDLVSCQLKWVLKHLLRLRPGNLQRIPDINQIIGNLAHELARRVFVPGTIPSPLEIQIRAAAEIDSLIETMAAPLLQPVHANELVHARERVCDGLRILAELLAARRLRIEGLEIEREHKFDGGLKVKSRIDLLARDPADKAAVIDLKWSRNESYRRRELADGRAIQLSTYSRLVEPGGGTPAGYFMIRQMRLLAQSDSPLATEEVAVKRSLDDTWDDITSTWGALSEALSSQGAIAIGVAGAANFLPADLPFEVDQKSCTYCDYTKLCRVTPGASS